MNTKNNKILTQKLMTITQTLLHWHVLFINNN